MWQWYNLVEEYSLRQLTVHADNGIAGEFAKHTGSFYIAGLWREHPPAGLLWHRRGSVRDPPSSDKLPSCSWARYSARVGC
jgi:hypothetical protein